MKAIFAGVFGLLAIAYFSIPEVDEQAEALRAWNFAAASQENRTVLLAKMHTTVSDAVVKESDGNSVFKAAKTEMQVDELALAMAFELRDESQVKKSLNRVQRLKFDASFLQMVCSLYENAKGKFDPVGFDVSIDHSDGRQIYRKFVNQAMCSNNPSLNQLGFRANTI